MDRGDELYIEREGGEAEERNRQTETNRLKESSGPETSWSVFEADDVMYLWDVSLPSHLLVMSHTDPLIRCYSRKD